MQTDITLSPPSVVGATNQTENVATDPAEELLTTEISTLWQVHTQVQGALRKTRDELRLIRYSLAHRLHELKAILARPGRGGAWSSFLESQQIPRSTADRLVRFHEKTLGVEDANCTTEQTTAPNEAKIHRYFYGLWPKLQKVLSTREAVETFVTELRGAAEKCVDAQEGARL